MEKYPNSPRYQKVPIQFYIQEQLLIYGCTVTVPLPDGLYGTL